MLTGRILNFVFEATVFDRMISPPISAFRNAVTGVCAPGLSAPTWLPWLRCPHRPASPPTSSAARHLRRGLLAAFLIGLGIEAQAQTINLNLSGGDINEGVRDAQGVDPDTFRAFSVSASSDVPEDIEVQVCFSGTATLDTTGATPITTGDYQVWIEATTTLLFIPQIVTDPLRSRCLSAKIYKEFQTGDRTQNKSVQLCRYCIGGQASNVSAWHQAAGGHCCRA